MKTTRLEISGMTCGHCVKAVEKALRSRPGVTTASVDLEQGAADVEYDESAVSPEQMIEAVEGEGYGAAHVDQVNP